jgi:hypothetical protein
MGLDQNPLETPNGRRGAVLQRGRESSLSLPAWRGRVKRRQRMMPALAIHVHHQYSGDARPSAKNNDRLTVMRVTTKH